MRAMSRDRSESDDSRRARERARAVLEAAQDDAARVEAAVDEALACARHEQVQRCARQRPPSVRAAAVLVGAIDSATAIAELCRLEGAERGVAAWALLEVVDPAELRALYESCALLEPELIATVIERLARSGRSEDVRAVLALTPQCDARTMRVMVELLPEELWRPFVAGLREALSVGRAALGDGAGELAEEALRALYGDYVLALTEPTRAARVEALEACDRILERAGDRVTFDVVNDPRAEAVLSWLWVGEVARAERWFRAIVAARTPWNVRDAASTETVEELVRAWRALSEKLAPEQQFRWEFEITAGLLARVLSIDGWLEVAAALESPRERRRAFEQVAGAFATEAPSRWVDPDVTFDAMPCDLRAPIEARALDTLAQKPAALVEGSLAAMLRAVSTDDPAAVARCVAALRWLQDDRQIAAAAPWLARAASAGVAEAVEQWRAWTSRRNASWAEAAHWYTRMPPALVRETIERIPSAMNDFGLASLCSAVSQWAEGESADDRATWWPEAWDALATSAEARATIAMLAPAERQADATRWFVENVANLRADSFEWMIPTLPNPMRSAVALAALVRADRTALGDFAGRSRIAMLVAAVDDERASLDALRSIATSLDEVAPQCLPNRAFARWIVDEQTAVSSALAQFGSLIDRLQRDPALGPCADALVLRASSALSTAPAVPERPSDESFALATLIAVASREALLSAVSQWTGDAPSPRVWLNALVRGTELGRDARDAVLRAIDLREVRFESRWSAVVLRRLRGATASLDDEPLPFDEMREDHVRQCARMGIEGELLSAVAREPRATRVRLLPALWRTIDAQTRERFAPMLIETAREEFDDNPWTKPLPRRAS